MIGLLAVAAGSLCLCAAWAWAPAAAPAAPATHTVAIEGMKFVPDVLTVKAGDTIVWVNKDLFPHTATSEKGGFDSGAIPSDQSWRYVTAKAGEFTYVCAFHPTMKGTLRVE